jgi:undecaprenyl-diphosphatase
VAGKCLGPGRAARPAGLTAFRSACLGAVQGPTELLPISSSAHLRIVPWMLGWDLDEISAEDRKAFEVAVHGGAALALLIGQRRLIAEELVQLDRRRLAVIALSFLPAVAIGLALEKQIGRHLGGPRATAAGLLAGSLAMIVADRCPQRRSGGEATALDGLVIGFAQAAALAPGVSRNGSTLAAARARGFSRTQANLLSRTVALPVIAAAAVRKATRLRRRDVDPALARSATIGVGVAFASTLASQGLIRLIERDRALWPYAAYRTALAAMIVVKDRRRRSRRNSG